MGQWHTKYYCSVHLTPLEACCSSASTNMWANMQEIMFLHWSLFMPFMICNNLLGDERPKFARKYNYSPWARHYREFNHSIPPGKFLSSLVCLQYVNRNGLWPIYGDSAPPFTGTVLHLPDSIQLFYVYDKFLPSLSSVWAGKINFVTYVTLHLQPPIYCFNPQPMRG